MCLDFFFLVLLFYHGVNTDIPFLIMVIFNNRNKMKQKTPIFTVFRGQKFIYRGDLPTAVQAAAKADKEGVQGRVVVYDDSSGKTFDINLQGSIEKIIETLADHPAMNRKLEHPEVQEEKPRKRGRPKLGVTTKEISLLPRHWQWLSRQKGSPSATLRRLVEESRRANIGKEHIEQSRDAIHNFMWDMCGNFEGFEEVTRDLYRNDFLSFYAKISLWPNDVKEYIRRLVEIYRAYLVEFQHSLK